LIGIYQILSKMLCDAPAKYQNQREYCKDNKQFYDYKM